MNRILSAVFVAAFFFAALGTSQAQNRTLGARSIVLDDGAGHTFTIQTPTPMLGNVIYKLAIPPAGNPPAGFVNLGTLGGQTLYWNSTNGDWEASNVITNNTNGNGTNVSITAPLMISSPTATATQLLLQAPSAGNTTAFQAQTQGANITYTLPASQAGVAGQVLTNNGSGMLSWTNPVATPGITVPYVVNFLNVYGAGTTYALNDLVQYGNLDTYYYSLTAANTGNQPDVSPGSWQLVPVTALNVIHKVLTLSAPGFTGLVAFEVPVMNTSGGRIQYQIRATDGVAQIACEQGVIQYEATANSITCTADVSDKLHLGTVNSGCTPGFFNPASRPGVSIFDNVSFSTPAAIVEHDVYYHVYDVSGQFSAAGATVTPIPFRLQ